MNTGAGRPAVSPQALGRFHISQFKIKLCVQLENTWGGGGGMKKLLSIQTIHIQDSEAFFTALYYDVLVSKSQ